jgi:energy-converting hydrogenase Eha subunit A
VVVGGLVMVLDPIFQGLAVALISGAIVATMLTMVVVPILYWELRRRESTDTSAPEIAESYNAHVAALPIETFNPKREILHV